MGCICKKAENSDNNVEFPQKENQKPEEPTAEPKEVKEGNLNVNFLIFNKRIMC